VFVIGLPLGLVLGHYESSKIIIVSKFASALATGKLQTVDMHIIQWTKMQMFMWTKP